MNPLNELFSGLWYVWFLGGMVSVQGWQWIKCKWKDHKYPEGAPHKMKKFNWFYVWTTLVLLAIVGVGVGQLRTYTFAEELARETQQCQLEFNQALRARSAITADNDHWSQVQRTALAHWIHDLIFPPPEIASMPIDDPVRQAWGILRTQEADKVIKEAQEEQEKNQQEREAHPLPDLSCGQ
jgi:hypothetical protein